MKKHTWVTLLTLSLGLSTQALGWDIHQTLMPSILDSVSPDLKMALSVTYPTPCEPIDQKFLNTLIQDLQLNRTTQVPTSASSSSFKTCVLGSKMSIQEILQGSSVDDPDQGMDRDLPAEYDPKEERTWMGGLTGPSSQGFRHMYFGGLKMDNFVATFQIPMRPIGQAINRAEVMAIKGKEYFKAGAGVWSIRVLGWALHYIQDLAQPFHAAQIINAKIIPWGELLSFPPSFSNFKQESIRTVSNYHWALEGYVRTRLKEGPTSPFAECLKNPKQYSTLTFSASSGPREIAEAVAKASIEIAPELGKAETNFFSLKLMQKDYNLSAFKGEMNYADYGVRPDLTESREALHKVVCQALANASIASRRLIEWTLLP